MKILDVKNLSVSFDGRKILNNVSFSMEEGHYVAVVGPNGAGKSTLVKTLVGENRHYHGEYKFDRSIKTTGYVAQQNNDGNYFPATAKEVIASGLSKIKFTPFLNAADKERIRAVIDELELEPLLQNSFFNLSGGQKRAVLIAREKFLILDEPTSGLDLLSTQRLYESIRRLNQKFNTAILMISHDIERVIEEASYILCIEHDLKFAGTTRDFIGTSLYRELLEHSV